MTVEQNYDPGSYARPPANIITVALPSGEKISFENNLHNPLGLCYQPDEISPEDKIKLAMARKLAVQKYPQLTTFK